MTIAYLGLGTNLGDRLMNLGQAIQSLSAVVTVLRSSRVYETLPVGFADQPKFLNQVAEIETELTPQDLLETVKHIELQMGRQKTFRDGPRLIDIDILFYGDRVIDLPNLTIPHPRLSTRAFVLAPLAELAPSLKHPVLGKTVVKMLEQVSQNGINLI